MIENLILVLFGVLLGSLISFLPRLHVFNLAGFGVALWLAFGRGP